MLEQRRVDYLKSMGITVWLPRRELPHAPASRWMAEDSPSERHEHIHIESTHDHARPVAAADLLRAGQPMPAHPQVAAEIANDAVSEPAKPADTKPLTPVSSESTEQTGVAAVLPSVSSGEPPRFALEFMQLSGSGIWVVDANIPLEQVTPFAGRVLAAFGMKPSVIPQPVSFRWPFIESRHQDQSEAVAVQALRAQWQYFSSQGAGYVITVGENAQSWMNKIDVKEHFHIPDLEALMSSASAKRALWLSLYALAER